MAIRVIVVLDSGGLGEKVIPLGSLTIANDGTSRTQWEANYNVTQHSKDSQRNVRKARVERHRRRDVSIWRLVHKALEALGHG